jgi:hypothetical protein
MSNKERHVITNHEVVLYKDKAPFVASGKSIAGAIEYNKEDDLLKCHECGRFQTMLGKHVNKVHGITARNYKKKHGLNQSTALVPEKVRLRLSTAAQKRIQKHGPPKEWFNPERIKKSLLARKRVKHIAAAERRNGVLHCKAQLMQKLRDVAKIMKRTPTRRELEEYGIPKGSLEYHYGSLAGAMKLAGLKPNGNIGNANHRRYSDEYLLRGIRLFRANWNRLPRATDYHRGMMTASRTLYLHRFGSLKRANKIAFTSTEKK